MKNPTTSLQAYTVVKAEGLQTIQVWRVLVMGTGKRPILIDLATNYHDCLRQPETSMTKVRAAEARSSRGTSWFSIQIDFLYVERPFLL